MIWLAITAEFNMMKQFTEDVWTQRPNHQSTNLCFRQKHHMECQNSKPQTSVKWHKKKNTQVSSEASKMKYIALEGLENNSKQWGKWCMNYNVPY